MLKYNVKFSFISIMALLVTVFTSWVMSDSFAVSGVVSTHKQTHINKPKPNQRTQLVEGNLEFRGVFCSPVTLTTENGHVDDAFGFRTAINGNIAVVSAELDNTLGDDAGAVYVFRKSGELWVEEQKLLASDGQSGERFGRKVAIHTDSLVVCTDPSVGSAYVFTFDGTSWQEQAKLIPWDLESGGGAAFGVSVGLDSRVIIIGAWADSSECAACGSAYIYRFDGTQWLPDAKLVASDATSGDEAWDFFGTSVGVSGDLAVVGKPRNNFPFAWGPGAAYVFRFDGVVWNEEAILTASNNVSGDMFGESVAIHGNNLIVGSLYGDGATYQTGSAYIFQFNGQGWDEVAYLFDPNSTNSDGFGSTVDIGNQFALVSPRWPDVNFVSTYAFDGISWFHTRDLSDPGSNNGFFGMSLYISGTTALIGSAGAAYLYDLTDDSCANIGDITGDGVVDVADLLAVIDMWGPCSGDCPADLDSSGVVDITDLLIVIANWD